jgi:hypothetical protein
MALERAVDATIMLVQPTGSDLHEQPLRCNTSGVKDALRIANHEHEHHLAFIFT